VHERSLLARHICGRVLVYRPGLGVRIHAFPHVLATSALPVGRQHLMTLSARGDPCPLTLIIYTRKAWSAGPCVVQAAFRLADAACPPWEPFAARPRLPSTAMNHDYIPPAGVRQRVHASEQEDTQWG